MQSKVGLAFYYNVELQQVWFFMKNVASYEVENHLRYVCWSFMKSW